MTSLLPDADLSNLVVPPPHWLRKARFDRLDEAAFFSGAALGHGHDLVQNTAVPHALWRARLALDAARSCVLLNGRMEGTADLRDEAALLRPGDMPGPSGEIYLQWRRAVERRVSVPNLQRALPEVTEDHIKLWLTDGKGGPVTRAAGVIEAVLTESPRGETAALMLADAVLARTLGWDHLVPVLAQGLTARDLRKTGKDLQLACHHAVVRSVLDSSSLASSLARRAAHMRAIAPKLRAKAADKAVEMFLTHDAVAPTALTGLMSDRAARRLCERLVSLGAVRELTGRDTFRIYGV